MDLTTTRRAALRVSTGLMLSAAFAVPAFAQTVQLTESSATVIRGGTYANTNLSADPVLATRASDDATDVRRVLLKFDTENTIPAGSAITSAKLTVTVAGGNAESRTISAYRIDTSYEALQATWKIRKTGTSWSSAGGDLAERVGSATVTNTVGQEVTFDVTALVQGAVNGNFSSRYTRVALVDTGGASRDSYKEYNDSDNAGDTSARPILTVTYGSASSPTPSSSGVKMRVLQWNLHHGTGTDGTYDINRIATWMATMSPDIVMLNEVEKFTAWGNEDQPARYQSLLESKTGKTWYSLFAQEFGDWSSNGKGHLILSTYPFDATYREAISYDRVIADARIIVNGRNVSLIVTHLDPDSQTRRLTQAKEVMTWAASIADNRILTGDMNAWPDQSSIAEYNKSYRDSWTDATAKGTAQGFSGLAPDGATKKGRIDYIFYSRGVSNVSTVSSQVYDTRDSSGYMPSDHRPVLTTFQIN